MTQPDTNLSERELEDDYPMHYGYLYVADGDVVRCEGRATTAKESKILYGWKSVKNCDFKGRDLWHLAI